MTKSKQSGRPFMVRLNREHQDLMKRVLATYDPPVSYAYIFRTALVEFGRNKVRVSESEATR